MRKKGVPLLTDRNIEVLSDFPRFRHLTSFQFADRYYPTTKHQTTTDRLATWERFGFVTRSKFYPKANDDAKGGRRTAVYFFTESNKRAIEEHLYERGKADIYAKYIADLPTIPTEEKAFSNPHLIHETGIAEIMHNLERSQKAAQHWQVLAWEITSPRSKDVPNKDVTLGVRTRSGATVERKYHFNPDAVAFLYNSSV